MTDSHLNNPRALSSERPFPGPYSYREVDSDFFRGRRQETLELTRLTLRNPLTVLFGASGTGKSSLLSAGLFPALRSRDHLPVRVNLKYDADGSPPAAPPDLAAQIMATVKLEANRQGHEVEQGHDCSTLWQFFHRLEIWNAKPTLLTPVIVLDQFEDAFVFAAQSPRINAAVQLLVAKLGDLIENRVPHALATTRRDDARADVVALSRRSPLVRVVIALREEYVPHLEGLKKEVPSVIKNRMRLLPFEGDRAARAISRSAPELLSPSVAEAVVRAVAGKRAGRAAAASLHPCADGPLESCFVEPSLLNLFCYQLNERRLAATGLDGAPAPQIDEGLIASASANILSDFYEDCLRGLSRSVRLFVEDHLLSSSGYRLQIPLVDARDQYGISEGAIDVLVSRRLVRRESRNDTDYLQLVHDVLAQTIRDARVRRRAQSRLRLLLAAALGTAFSALCFIAYFLLLVQQKGDDAILALNPQLLEKRGELSQANVEVERIRQQLDAARRARDESDRETQRAREQERAAARDAQEAIEQWQRAERSAREATAAAMSARRNEAVANEAAVAAQGKVEALTAQANRLERNIELLQMRNGIPPQPR